MLVLNHNNLHDQAAIALANTTSIQMLDLSYNHISSVGIEALENNKTITDLNTEGNDGSKSKKAVNHDMLDNVLNAKCHMLSKFSPQLKNY